MTGERGRQAMDQGATEFSVDELREFLEGDRLDVRADPEFKERLRARLWEMLRSRRARPDDEAG